MVEPQSFLMVPDSVGDRIILFNPVSGLLENDNFIDGSEDTGLGIFKTPINAIQVNDEIWVADQVADALFRFDLNGGYLGVVGDSDGDGDTDGLDNIRGIEFAGGSVYVSNSGDDNDAPGDGEVVVVFNPEGENLGFFDTGDPYDIFAFNGELLISDINSESDGGEDIDRYTLDGINSTFIDTFVESDGETGIDFPQQISMLSNGNLLVAGFSLPGGFYEYDASGNQVDLLNADDGFAERVRAAYQLEDGNILWSGGDGIVVTNPMTGENTDIYTVNTLEFRPSTRYIEPLTGPAPMSGRDGYQPGDAFNLVTPPPTYEGELSSGEEANANFVDQLEGDALLDELQDGGYVIYFRHAMTERDFADQVTADVNDFSTQRVLSEFGIKQSLAIGEGFENGNIPIDEVFTSDYGRAVKTAAIAFGEYQKDSALNFLPFEDYTDAQVEEMRANITPFLTAEPNAGTNTVIVGHDDLFEAGTGIYPDPQGIAYILDPDGSGGFDLVANILPEEWVQLTGEDAEDGDMPMPVESDGGIGDGAGPIPTEEAEASNGYQPGDAFGLVTPPPTYESELSFGEQANAEFVDLLEGEALLEELQDGGHVIYFRHAMTERDFADQVTADVTDFSTQRVVSEFGVKQSLAIGEGFDLGEIPVDEVITSEYGRAVETAAIAFGEYQKDAALNFLPFEDYTDVQVEEMRANIMPFLTAVPDAGTNTVIVGHDDLFEAGAGIYPDPQGIAYVLTPDGNDSFEIVANLLPEEWVQLSAFIPNELLGTNGRDRLFGTEGNDTISVLAGNDGVFGGSGNDIISGGSGNDRIFGGEGNDTINGDSEQDKLFGGAGNDIIDGGSERDRLFGESGNDFLSGGSERDAIFGGDGNDTIDGGSERDRLFGDAGNDILTGGSGRDALFGGTGQDILVGGNGRDRIFGEEDRDILIGDMGDDFLSGGAGDDVLMGVTGNDTLAGGDGADLFVFGVGDGTDRVKDFEVGIDKIGLVDGELIFADI
ncbi:MAG: histidine phosphatase family protein, partial [Cyanobacteria bacterium J06560_2]